MNFVNNFLWFAWLFALISFILLSIFYLEGVVRIWVVGISVLVLIVWTLPKILKWRKQNDN